MRISSKFRFSLATMMLGVTAWSIWLGVVSIKARQQAAAVSGVESNEGIVEFDTKLDAPDWLRNVIGEEYFRDAKTVDLATNRGLKQGGDQPKATDASIRNLKSLRSVEILELGNSKVTDSGLTILKALRKLKVVYLYRTQIRGSGLAHLADLPKLEGLSLSNTPLEDSGVSHIGKMSNLTWVHLDNTRVTDASMPKLAKATNLKRLKLNNT